jgi:uncharacterized protein (DUF2235 family)
MPSNNWLQNSDSTLTGDVNFDTTDLEGFNTSSDSPLLPDGTVNWPSWDAMVAQYGMDVDENQANGGHPMPYGSTFSSLTQWY